MLKAERWCTADHICVIFSSVWTGIGVQMNQMNHRRRRDKEERGNFSCLRSLAWILLSVIALYILRRWCLSMFCSISIWVPEGKLEQSLDINKLVFKEQLSLIDAARQYKLLLLNTILHVAEKPETKISLCALALMNIYVAVFCVWQNEGKNRPAKEEEINSHSLFATHTTLCIKARKKVPK